MYTDYCKTSKIWSVLISITNTISICIENLVCRQYFFAHTKAHTSIKKSIANLWLHFQTPPSTFKRQIDIHYGSLPRQQFISNGGLTTVDSNANPANEMRRGVAFGKGISSLLGVRARGHSVPNLGERSVSRHAASHSRLT